MGCGGSTVRVEQNGSTEPQHTSKGHTAHERQGDTLKAVRRSDFENDLQNGNGPQLYNTQQRNEAEFEETPKPLKNDTGTKIDEVITASADEAEGDHQSGKEPLITQQQNDTEVVSTKKPPDENNNDSITRSLLLDTPNTNEEPSLITPHNAGDVSDIPSQEIVRKLHNTSPK